MAEFRGARLDRLVTCVDGNKLVDLIDKHSPGLFQTSPQSSEAYLAVLDVFEKMLDMTDLQRGELRKFLVQHSWLVGIGRTHANIDAWDEYKSYPEVDLSLETFEHDYDVMVLRSHTDEVVSDNEEGWGLSDECEAGICQVYRYFEWYQETLEREHYRGRSGVYWPEGFVVVGRNTRKEIKDKLRLINERFQRMRVLTYDDLCERAKRWIELGTTRERQ